MSIYISYQVLDLYDYNIEQKWLCLRCLKTVQVNRYVLLLWFGAFIIISFVFNQWNSMSACIIVPREEGRGEEEGEEEVEMEKEKRRREEYQMGAGCGWQCDGGWAMTCFCTSALSTHNVYSRVFRILAELNMESLLY